jgi:large subunit ribosomal protein L17
MFRNMVTSLLKHDRIKTTEAKAKELRRWADHVITLAKRGDLHARRLAMSIVREKDVVHKIFEEATERFGASNGGYTRIVKIGRRSGDAAPFTLVELVNSDGMPSPKTKKTKAAAKTEIKTADTEIQVDEKYDAASKIAEPAVAETSVKAETVKPDSELAGGVDESAKNPETTPDTAETQK